MEPERTGFAKQVSFKTAVKGRRSDGQMNECNPAATDDPMQPIAVLVNWRCVACHSSAQWVVCYRCRQHWSLLYSGPAGHGRPNLQPNKRSYWRHSFTRTLTYTVISAAGLLHGGQNIFDVLKWKGKSDSRNHFRPKNDRNRALYNEMNHFRRQIQKYTGWPVVVLLICTVYVACFYHHHRLLRIKCSTQRTYI